MGSVILVRHGRSVANRDHILAGRTAGVALDDAGRAQAASLATRLADCRIARIVSSPIQRCRETVAPLAELFGLEVEIDDDLAEVDYGEWTGRKLADLRAEPLWRTVQEHPSAMVFPGGESLAQVSTRAVAAARRYGVDPLHAPGDRPDAGGAVLLCSHGDVLGAIVADALGMHLDLFQRLVIAPASISVVHYGATRSFVDRLGDTGSLAGIGRGGRPAEAPSEATVGGVTGSPESSA